MGLSMTWQRGSGFLLGGATRTASLADSVPGVVADMLQQAVGLLKGKQ